MLFHCTNKQWEKLKALAKKKIRKVQTWLIIQILGIFLLIFLSFKNTKMTVIFVTTPVQAMTTIIIFIASYVTESSLLKLEPVIPRTVKFPD